MFDNDYRLIVRHARIEREERWVGGDTYCNEFTYRVFVEAVEPVEVITKGGGTCLVLPLEQFRWEWPPPEADVYRHGRIIYPRATPTKGDLASRNP